MFRSILYSFPIQLLLNHIKRNKVLLFFWLILLSITTGGLGGFLGLHYLFLDPEYLEQSSFLSFAIMGGALGGFTMAFHVTTYIIDIHRFTFVGALSRPFNKFCLNNSIIPIAYLVTYISSIIYFQLIDQQYPLVEVFFKVLGLLVGYISVLILIFSYMYMTHKDIKTYLPQDTFSQFKHSFFYRVDRARRRLLAQKKPFTVYSYFETPWRLGATKDLDRYYNTAAILKIFNQTQRNLLFFEVLAIVLLLALGFLADHSTFSQIPAAASGILFLTILVMFTGLLSFWTRGWLATVIILCWVVLNSLAGKGLIFQEHGSHAFGLDYKKKKTSYALSQIRNLNSKANYIRDKEHTLKILNNWRKKFPANKPPKILIVCASGGGQRAALWAMNVLQTADHSTAGKLMKHTMLMSCVSGGALGVGYFRELYLRYRLGESINPYDKIYLDRISKNSHNPIVFNLLTNDMLFNLNTFRYRGMRYRRDRGYVLEEQVNKHTGHILEKSLKDYREPEIKSTIPMLFLTPTIVNDGRKLFISPQNVSYMGADVFVEKTTGQESKIKGIDFMRCFESQGAENLRFLTALRMAATYPYMLPSVTLPSEPAMEIMDAALFDNFGITDAVRFLYVFRDWIAEHTSGVGLVIIRSSAKEREVETQGKRSLWQMFTSPIGNLQAAWENMQDIRNNDLVEFASPWFKDNIVTLEFQCALTQQNREASIRQLKNADSLSWHMTTEEKQGILQAIHTKNNQASLKRLKSFLK